MVNESQLEEAEFKHATCENSSAKNWWLYSLSHLACPIQMFIILVIYNFASLPLFLVALVAFTSHAFSSWSKGAIWSIISQRTFIAAQGHGK
jgi:hypothetical protein